MADITWTGTVNDDFNTADNWNPQSVPGMAHDAVIGTDTGGTPAAVTTSASDTINSLAMVATASLSINGGEFTILDGSGTTGLAGTIDVNNADGAVADRRLHQLRHDQLGGYHKHCRYHCGDYRGNTARRRPAAAGEQHQ